MSVVGGFTVIYHHVCSFSGKIVLRRLDRSEKEEDLRKHQSAKGLSKHKDRDVRVYLLVSVP